MKKTDRLLLVDGKFTPEESLEILMNLFGSKLQFHKMKNFSSQERFGTNDTIASKRIPELQKTIEDLTELIRSAEKNNETLAIKSEIVISRKKK